MAAFEKKWTPEDQLKLVLVVWQHENPQLSVQGWRNMEGRIQQVFGDKFNLPAVQTQWQRLRRSYFTQHPLDKPPEGSSGSNIGKGKKSVAYKDLAASSRKRAASTPDSDIAAANLPKSQHPDDVPQALNDRNERVEQVQEGSGKRKRARTLQTHGSAAMSVRAQEGDAVTSP